MTSSFMVFYADHFAGEELTLTKFISNVQFSTSKVEVNF